MIRRIWDSRHPTDGALWIQRSARNFVYDWTHLLHNAVLNMLVQRLVYDAGPFVPDICANVLWDVIGYVLYGLKNCSPYIDRKKLSLSPTGNYLAPQP